VRRRGHKTAPWSNTDTREYCIKPLIGASSRIEEGIDFSVRHKLAIFPVVTVACRPRAIVPVTHGLVFLLIHVSARSLVETLIVLLAVPFSAVGAIWLFYPLHCEMSMAVWADLIGLLSIDAETCAFRLLYLDLPCADAKLRGCLNTVEELHQAILYGAAKRLLPISITFAATCNGLFR
jgi:Cu(I)/Ag(I) efflux system membrane protein CusA/SilA